MVVIASGLIRAACA